MKKFFILWTALITAILFSTTASADVAMPFGSPGLIGGAALLTLIIIAVIVAVIVISIRAARRRKARGNIKIGELADGNDAEAAGTDNNNFSNSDF